MNLDIGRAIAQQELRLVYQPVIDLATGGLAGVEALVRWQHAQHGLLHPAEFVGSFEENGSIHALTRWVVAEALQQWSAWRSAGFTPQLAINVSAKDLGRIDFPDTAGALCREHQVPCETITIEVTETARADAIDVLDTLTRLRLKGFRGAIDDFGTGFAQLAQLRDLPFSDVKLDRSFIAAIDQSRSARIIISSVIDLAHNLGLKITAEGVESATTLNLLRELGCDAAQGHLIAEALAGERMLEWAAAWQGEPTRPVALAGRHEG